MCIHVFKGHHGRPLSNAMQMQRAGPPSLTGRAYTYVYYVITSRHVIYTRSLYESIDPAL